MEHEVESLQREIDELLSAGLPADPAPQKITEQLRCVHI